MPVIVASLTDRLDSFDRTEIVRAQMTSARMVRVPAERGDLAFVHSEMWRGKVELRHADCGIVIAYHAHSTDAKLSSYACCTGGCPGRWLVTSVKKMDALTFARMFFIAPVPTESDMPLYAIVEQRDVQRGGFVASRIMEHEEVIGYYRNALREARKSVRTR